MIGAQLVLRLALDRHTTGSASNTLHLDNALIHIFDTIVEYKSRIDYTRLEFALALISIEGHIPCNYNIVALTLNGWVLALKFFTCAQP